MESKKRLLYVGDCWFGSTSEMRMRALQSLGFEVTCIDTTKPGIDVVKRHPLVYSSVRLGFPIDTNEVNRKILEVSTSYDVIWLDKALVIRRETLLQFRRKFPDTWIVGFSPDDMSNRVNLSRYFPATLPLYDIYLTTKTYNVAELTAAGCVRPLFTGNGYDPLVHQPRLSDASEPRIEVGFIGTFERPRSQAIQQLATDGIAVTVNGLGWKNRRVKAREYPNVEFGPPIYNINYAEQISETRVNLGFLRRSMRDLQTTRTVEVPACEGFMLMERTEEQQELFQEGVEAEFFDGYDELHEKVNFYLDNECQRVAIAQAGRARCITSDYSWAGQLGRSLKEAGIL